MLDTDETVEELAKMLKCGPGEVLAKVQKIMDENQKLKDKIEALKDKIEALKDFVNECTTFRG